MKHQTAATQSTFDCGHLRFPDSAHVAGLEPDDRLKAFVLSLLSRPTVEDSEEMLRGGLAALGRLDPDASAECAKAREKLIDQVGEFILGIHAGRGEALDREARRELALAVASVVGGLWVERALNPLAMTPGEAQRIALDMIGARLGVSFA